MTKDGDTAGRVQASTALKNLRKLQRVPETPIVFENFARELTHEKSDRAAIVMCASLIDTGLKGSLWTKMPNKEAAALLFDDNGPLHSLDAKIRIGEALGLFGTQTRRNLDLIQTIRNAFAHSLSVVSFETPEVAAACDALVLPEVTTLSLSRKRPKTFGTHREKFVWASQLIMEAIFFSGVGFENGNGVHISPPP